MGGRKGGAIKIFSDDQTIEINTSTVVCVCWYGWNLDSQPHMIQSFFLPPLLSTPSPPSPLPSTPFPPLGPLTMPGRKDKKKDKGPEKKAERKRGGGGGGPGDLASFLGLSGMPPGEAVRCNLCHM